MPVIIQKGIPLAREKSMPAGNMFDPNLPIFQDPLLHQLIASLGPQNADQVAILAAAWRAPELRQAAQAALDAGHGIEGVRSFVVQSTIDRINSGNGPQLAQGVAQFLQAAGQQPQPWMGQTIAQAYGGGSPSGPTVTGGPDKGRTDVVDDVVDDGAATGDRGSAREAARRAAMAARNQRPTTQPATGTTDPSGHGINPDPAEGGGATPPGRWMGQQPPPGINAPPGAIGYKYRNGKHLFMMPGGANGGSFSSQWVPYVPPAAPVDPSQHAPPPTPARQGAESYSAVSGYGQDGRGGGSPPFNPNGTPNDTRPHNTRPHDGGGTDRPTRPHTKPGGGMNNTPPIVPQNDKPTFSGTKGTMTNTPPIVPNPQRQDLENKRIKPKPTITL